MNLTCKIDTTGLSAGIVAAHQYSRRTLPQIVNTSAYWIFVNAKNSVPFVTPEKVDAELFVVSTPVIGKRGKPLKRKKAYSARPVSHGVPFAAQIIAARANPNSKYNRMTGGRYALPKNPFKGVSRAAGAAAMRHFIDVMVKSRHRSGKFLVAGFIPAIQKMAAYAVQKFMRGGPSPSEGKRSYYGASLGDAKPAQDGDNCTAVVENDIGLEGKNRASMNRALLTYGAPALQAAVDREGRRQMDYALKKAEQELAAEVNRHWS